MITCYVCGKDIVKYEMDVSDTVCIDGKYICDDCSHEIALQRISR